jgi:putative polyketide hydroxylase
MRKHDVVVVGAGAAGLTAAVTLARAGVDVLILEKRSAVSTLPRATVLSLRTMEMLRSWGLEARVLSGGDSVEMTMLETPTAAQAEHGTRIDVGYPTAAQSSIISATEAACVAQDHFESVLSDFLLTLGSATVERGVELVDLVSNGEGVAVTTRDLDGRYDTVVADYVIGADGFRSAVRSALGITMVGPDGIFSSLLVEFRAPLWEVLGDHRHLLYFITDPDSTSVLLPAGLGDRWLFAPYTGFDLNAIEEPDHEDLRNHIGRAAGVPELDIRIERVGRFSSGAQTAERFSDGRVFLVGDAAHRVTPRGGTGLNIAVADGFDLGWKLGWVCRGWASESLLATYERERRPLVEHNVERSSDPLGSRRTPLTEVNVDLGGRIRHVWIDPYRVSTLDVIGDGLTLFVAVGSEWEHASLLSRSATPISVVPLEPIAARGLGISSDGALLVRPDAVPVANWWSSVEAEARLSRAVDDLLGYADRTSIKPETAA